MRRKGVYRPYGGRRRRWLPRVLLCLLLAGVLAFGALEALIFSGSRDQLHGEPQVMVVFGCQVKPWGPSVLLQDRLDTALAYLEEHPEMTVVVTGGQGDDEPVSEAQCMYDYLTEHGVDGSRIVKEDRSRNTWQNINYTLTLFQDGTVAPAEQILLASSGFHLTRIRMLWERVWPGTYTLSVLAAPVSHAPSAVQMFFREPLALVKSWLLDRPG